MIEWPDTLVEDVARRRAILFLGSGVSANSIGTGGKHPPTWNEFLESAIDVCSEPTDHIHQLLQEHDYLTASDILKNRLADAWGTLIDREFREPKYEHAKIHEEIFKLDCRIVLTQNVDKIYDTYAQQQSNNTVVIKHYYDPDVAQVAREHHFVILKAHGTIDSKKRMILTREEYGAARFEFGAFYEFLDALAVTHSLVFLGCGLSDPDVQLLLVRNARRFPFGRPHYMCVPQDELHQDVRESVTRNYNIQLLQYSPEDRHAELLASVENLVGRAAAKRDDLAVNQDW